MRAHNSEGWGDYSDINTSGATIESNPLELTTLSQDITQLTNTQIKLVWTAPSSGLATGGSSVALTGYKVYWDLGTGAAMTAITSTTDTFYLVTSLTGGQTYSFKVVAMNKYGEGPLSSTTSFSVKTG